MCGHITEIDYPYGVDVTDNPELKEEVLSGRFFNFTCENDNCKKPFSATLHFVYTDLNKNYIICLTDEANYSLGRRYDENTTPVYYVSSYRQLQERIYELDLGLSIPVCEFYKIVARRIVKEQKKKELEEGTMTILDTYITKSPDDKLHILVETIGVGSEGKKRIVIPLPNQQNIRPSILERLEKMNPYYANEKYVEKVLYMGELEYELCEEEEHTIAICRQRMEEDNDKEFCVLSYVIPNHIKDQIQDGDKVCVIDNHSIRPLYGMTVLSKATLKNIDIPYDIGYLGTISCKIGKNKDVKIDSFNEEIDNDDLILLLKAYKHSGIFPSDLAMKANVLLAYESASEDNIYPIETKTAVVNVRDIYGDENEEEKNLKCFTIYLDEESFPNNSKYKKQIVSFHSAMSLFINNAGRYHCVLLKWKDDDLFLLNEKVVNLLITSLLDRKTKLDSFLKSLTSVEKDILSPEQLQFFNLAYVENSDKETLIESLELDSEDDLYDFAEGALFGFELLVHSRAVKLIED